jgi:hypothetical protein
MPVFSQHLHSVFTPSRRSRNPLARALSLVIGIALVGVLLVFGLVVASVLLVGGAIVLALRQWNRRNKPIPAAARPQSSEVIEGEFVVLQQRRHATH